MAIKKSRKDSIEAIGDAAVIRQTEFETLGYDPVTAKHMALKEEEATYRIQTEVNKNIDGNNDILSVALREENPGIDEASLRQIVNEILH